MKRNLYPIVVCMFAGLLIAAVSCQKKSNNNNCRISAYVDTFGNKIVYGYDSKHRIVTINNTNFPSSQRTFTYSNSNTYIKQTDSSGNVIETDTVTTNDKGAVTSLVIYNKALYPIPVKIHYNYDVNGQLTSSKTTHATNTSFIYDSSFYKWADGDMVSISNLYPQAIITYSYYITETTTGDISATDQIAKYGVLIYKNKHLSKSINNGPHYEYYTYKYPNGSSQIAIGVLDITDAVTKRTYNQRKYTIDCN